MVIDLGDAGQRRRAAGATTRRQPDNGLWVQVVKNMSERGFPKRLIARSYGEALLWVATLLLWRALAQTGVIEPGAEEPRRLACKQQDVHEANTGRTPPHKVRPAMYYWLAFCSTLFNCYVI